MKKRFTEAQIVGFLREADAGGHCEILVEKLPPTAGGLAAAINDRLKRAAAKR